MKGFDELFKKNYFFDDPDFEKHCNAKGFVKKKLDRNAITKMFQQSMIKYFCFHLKGKLLCYYEKEPVSYNYTKMY